jgi:hypothetical protein
VTARNQTAAGSGATWSQGYAAVMSAASAPQMAAPLKSANTTSQ